MRSGGSWRRRKRVLYGSTYYRCRGCRRAVYDSQYEPAYGRPINRALKIRQRLGCQEGIDAPFPPKPKGMHWKTCERLERIDEDAQNLWAALVMHSLKMFQ